MRTHESLDGPTRGRTPGPRQNIFNITKKNMLQFNFILNRLERADEVVELPQAKVCLLFWLDLTKWRWDKYYDFYANSDRV